MFQPELKFLVFTGPYAQDEANAALASYRQRIVMTQMGPRVTWTLGMDQHGQLMIGMFLEVGPESAGGH